MDSDETVKVYIIAHFKEGSYSGPVKIGVARNPSSRAQSLQTGNPHRLGVIAEFGTPNRAIASAIEEAFHEVMSSHVLVGEWFDMPPERAAVAMCTNYRMALSATAPSLDSEMMNEALRLAGVLDMEEKLRAAGIEVFGGEPHQSMAG